MDIRVNHWPIQKDAAIAGLRSFEPPTLVAGVHEELTEPTKLNL